MNGLRIRRRYHGQWRYFHTGNAGSRIHPAHAHDTDVSSQSRVTLQLVWSVCLLLMTRVVLLA